MNFKKPSMNQVAMIAVAAIVIYLAVTYCKKSESYSLRPTKIDISVDDTEKSIFDLPVKMECVPGPEADASAYTVGLTPGGICGAQEEVVKAADYVITDGIGDTKLGE